jgi:Cytochrome P450
MEFTTSDIISDYCFAESYGQLKSGIQEPAIAGLHKFIPLESKLSAMTFTIRMVFILHAVGFTQMKVLARAQEQVKRRLEVAADQKDMMNRVLKHISEDGEGMSMDELGRNAMILMLAGSETTATTLAGAMYHLLKNPGALERLTKELRGSFESATDMTMAKARSIYPRNRTNHSAGSTALSKRRLRRNTSGVFSRTGSAHASRPPRRRTHQRTLGARQRECPRHFVHSSLERPLSELPTVLHFALRGISPTRRRSGRSDGCLERILNSTTTGISSFSRSPPGRAIVWEKSRDPFRDFVLSDKYR